MDNKKKKELILLFTPAGITFLVLLLLTISEGMWKFDLIDIMANFITIFIFVGIVFGVTYRIMNDQKTKQRKAEELRIVEERKRFEEEQSRLKAEEDRRKYNEWFNSLSEAEKQTELQKQYYRNQLRLEQEKIEIEKRNQEIQISQMQELGRLQEQQIAELKTANSLRQEQMNAMLKCPKCGSTSITGQKKGYGVVKGGLGAAALGTMTGGVGVIVGLGAGNIGRNKVKCTCMNCGYKFKAGKKQG